jgi:hypothetical protein
MKAADLIRDLSSLPPEAQREVIDFIDFLKTRYPSPQATRKSGQRKLKDEPFIGMWREREDMRDSAAWVRDLRQKEWNPKL